MSGSYQPTLFDQAEGLVLGDLADLRRIELTDGAWVDVLPGWLSGSDVLLEHLLQGVPWRAEKRQMYEQVVSTPRLLCWYSDESGFPHPVLDDARRQLNAHYRSELGEPFVTAGLCLYRDGRDSVAWHGDRIGRGAHENTMVAILSVGSGRNLLLRPRRTDRPDDKTSSTGRGQDSGPSVEPGPPAAADRHRGSTPRHSVKIPSGHGDLLVMGGSCQRTWEHAIPKTAHTVGPRISIQFRPVGVA